MDNYALAAFEDPSGPALTGTSINETLDLGSVAMGGGALTATLGVLNAATGLSDLLGGTLTSAGGAGFTNSGFGSFGGLGAGQDEHAQTVSLATGTAGTFSETVVLSSYGTNASGYYGALTTETLTITGTVMASNFVTYTLDSGPQRDCRCRWPRRHLRGHRRIAEQPRPAHRRQRREQPDPEGRRHVRHQCAEGLQQHPHRECERRPSPPAARSRRACRPCC